MPISCGHTAVNTHTIPPMLCEVVMCSGALHSLTVSSSVDLVDY